MDKTTVLCGLLALAAALPALDAALRLRRLAAKGEGARDTSGECARGRILAVIPARAEGARVGDLAEDLRREGKKREEKISLKGEETGAGGGVRRAAPRGAADVDVLVVLDGPDPEAEARLARDGVHYLSKKSLGPTKGHALAFLAASIGDRLDSYDFILVFDADMRLPEGFFRDLVVPEGVEAFQLPVRPAGIPGSGAARVEALSLAEAAGDDLARDAEGLPVRLRGKAMGFTPRAFRLGPAVATRTTVEDSEATLRLLAAGVRVRALEGPIAFDEPSAEAGAMARSRSRWFGGQLKLVFVGFGNLMKLAISNPKGAFVLACDLWLRPRIFLLGALAFLALVSDVVLVFSSSNGTWSALAQGSGVPAAVAGVHARPIALLVLLLLLSFSAKSALVCEWLSLAALRRSIGYPPEVPSVSFSDAFASVSMWARAVFAGVAAPSRWHRARPPR